MYVVHDWSRILFYDEALLDSVFVFLEQANDQSVVSKTGPQKGLKVHPRPDCEVICRYTRHEPIMKKLVQTLPLHQMEKL